MSANAMKQSQIDSVISNIYEAPLDLDRWRDTLEAVAKLVGAAGGGHFFMFDPVHSRVMLSHTPTWMSRAGEATYNEHYLADDPRRLLVNTVAPGQWIYDHEHFDARYVSRSEVYQFLIGHDIRFLAASNLVAEPDLLATFSVFRSPDQREFGRREQDILDRLSPHLMRAARLSLQLDEVRAQLKLGLTALDSLPDAVVVTDKPLRIVLQNRRAEALFREATRVRILGGKIGARSADEQRQLERAVNDAIEANVGCLLELAGGDRYPLFCRVLPAADSNTVEVAALKPRKLAVLIFKDTVLSTSQVSAVARVYQLTPAETRVAELLVSGVRPHDIAVALGVSANTVKTHLKRVFEKTRTHRQSELLALFSSAAL
jgi:DNA-binding CsgD family transcriptional regulator